MTACITFDTASGIAFSTGSLALNILRGPLELIGGVAAGSLVGLAYYPLQRATLPQRSLIVILTGVTLVLAGKFLEVRLRAWNFFFLPMIAVFQEGGQ